MKIFPLKDASVDQRPDRKLNKNVTEISNITADHRNGKKELCSNFEKRRQKKKIKSEKFTKF